MIEKTYRAPLPLGTKTPWGDVSAVGILHGPPPERYYWMVRGPGDVAMMPASTVEPAVWRMEFNEAWRMTEGWDIPDA